MTLEELSKYIDVSRQTMSRYETGAIKGVPSDKIELIASALRTTPAYLMGWEDTPPWDGSGGHKNSARLQPCGTKGKGARNEDLLSLL